jgi:hypothetical protein
MKYFCTSAIGHRVRKVFRVFLPTQVCSRPAVAFGGVTRFGRFDGWGTDDAHEFDDLDDLDVGWVNDFLGSGYDFNCSGCNQFVVNDLNPVDDDDQHDDDLKYDHASNDDHASNNDHYVACSAGPGRAGCGH